MSRRRGFTLVELIITITVMVILMTLAVASIRSSQVQARDNERKSDVENIARQLDSLYTTGVNFTYSGTPMSIKGAYPSVMHLGNAGVRAVVLVEIPQATQIDPKKATPAESFFVATNNRTGLDASNAATAVAPFPGEDTPYVYQALKDDGTLCSNTEECTRFFLYYYQEASPTPGVVESRYH